SHHRNSSHLPNLALYIKVTGLLQAQVRAIQNRLNELINAITRQPHDALGTVAYRLQKNKPKWLFYFGQVITVALRWPLPGSFFTTPWHEQQDSQVAYR